MISLVLHKCFCFNNDTEKKTWQFSKINKQKHGNACVCFYTFNQIWILRSNGMPLLVKEQQNVNQLSSLQVCKSCITNLNVILKKLYIILKNKHCPIIFHKYKCGAQLTWVSFFQTNFQYEKCSKIIAN